MSHAWCFPCGVYPLQTCTYGFPQLSGKVQAIALGFLQRLDLVSRDRGGSPRRHAYISLHLRRGDAAEQCNSSTAAAVAAHVQCSLSSNSTRTVADRDAATLPPLPLVLFSDEQSQHYLNGVIGMLRKLREQTGAPVGSVTHGDALLRQLARDAFAHAAMPPNSTSTRRAAEQGSDNFLIFAASAIIRAFSAVKLQLRRGFCSCGVLQALPLEEETFTSFASSNSLLQRRGQRPSIA